MSPHIVEPGLTIKYVFADHLGGRSPASSYYKIDLIMIFTMRKKGIYIEYLEIGILIFRQVILNSFILWIENEIEFC